MKFIKTIFSVALVLLLSSFTLAQEEEEEKEERGEEVRLKELELELQKLKKLEEERRLKELLEEAEIEEEMPRPQVLPFFGAERSLQLSNPEISVTTDLIGVLNSSSFREDIDEGDEEGEAHEEEGHHHEHSLESGFHLSEMELAFQSPLDPYSIFKAFVGFHGDGHIHLEECYISWMKVLPSMTLSAGRFRQNFGTINRWHPHAAEQIDTPYVLKNYFGHHGLTGTGLSINSLLPSLWASTESIILEVTASENDHLYPEDHYLPSFLLNLKNFYEISPSLYFEFCLTGYHGYRDRYATQPVTLTGADFSFVYEPVQWAKYRTLEIRGEFINSFIDYGDGIVQSRGGYGYLLFKSSIRWIWGIRVDYTGTPEDLSKREWGISPVITFWQSEFVRLRAQYSHVERNFEEHGKPPTEEILLFQIDFSAGPHKHEKY